MPTMVHTESARPHTVRSSLHISPSLARAQSTTSPCGTPPAEEKKVLELMAIGADMELRFADGSSAVMSSTIFSLASSRFRGIFGSDDANYEKNAEGLKIIDISEYDESTSRSSFLQVAPFLYPNNTAKVTWDNLEAVLSVSSQWDMPVILNLGAAYFKENCKYMDTHDFVWKWLLITDKPARSCPQLDKLCKICIDRVVLYAGKEVSAYIADCIMHLSPATMRQILLLCGFKGRIMAVTPQTP